MAQVTRQNKFICAQTWAARWDCSISSIRRAAKRFRVRRVYVGDGRNGLVRFALQDIMRVEKENGLEPSDPSFASESSREMSREATSGCN